MPDTPSSRFLKRLELRQRFKPFTGRELVDLMTFLEMTPETFARQTGNDLGTIRRWQTRPDDTADLGGKNLARIADLLSNIK